MVMRTNLSHAKCAHAYDLAISSSTFRLLVLLRDWARRDTASSTSSGGRGPLEVGIRPLRAWIMDLSIWKQMLARGGDLEVVEACAHDFDIIRRRLARRRMMIWRVSVLVLIGLAGSG